MGGLPDEGGATDLGFGSVLGLVGPEQPEAPAQAGGHIGSILRLLATPFWEAARCCCVRRGCDVCEASAEAGRKDEASASPRPVATLGVAEAEALDVARGGFVLTAEMDASPLTPDEEIGAGGSSFFADADAELAALFAPIGVGLRACSFAGPRHSHIAAARSLRADCNAEETGGTEQMMGCSSTISGSPCSAPSESDSWCSWAG